MHDRLSPAPPCRACHVSPALRGVRAPSSAPTRASWRAASRPARHAHAMRPSMRSVGRPPPSGQHRVFLRAPAKPDIAMRTAPTRPAVTRVSQPASTNPRPAPACLPLAAASHKTSSSRRATPIGGFPTAGLASSSAHAYVLLTPPPGPAQPRCTWRCCRHWHGPQKAGSPLASSSVTNQPGTRSGCGIAAMQLARCLSVGRAGGRRAGFVLTSTTGKKHRL